MTTSPAGRAKLPAVRISKSSFGAVGFLGLVFGFVGCGDGGGSDDGSCIPGTYFCSCVNGLCAGGLICESGFCFGGGDETSGDGDPGDGDPGDGDPGDGDPGDGDPGDGDPGDGDPGDGDGDPNGCSFPLTPTPSDVMFVVDTSGSMVGSTWDHDANGNTPNVTRWYSLHAALDATLDDYAPLLHAGLTRFPSSTASSMYNATACTTSDTPEAPMDVGNGAGIMAAIPAQAATNAEIKGGTPTTLGIVTAVDHLTSQGISSTPSIVLMTDGAANCDLSLPFPNILEDYDVNLVPTLEDASFDGIITHVVGIAITNALIGSGNDGTPYANPYVVLNDAAVAGGAPLAGSTKFHDAGTQAELSTALAAVLDPIACLVDLTRLPEGPPTLAQVPGVAFEIDGSPIPYVDSCASGNGWTWVQEGEQVRFCGTYCQDYKDGPTSIDAGYDCP